MQKHNLSVSQLNHQIKFLLETHYGHINVTGEISNLATPASGHIYFTLKDSRAQVRCAMFKSSLLRNSFRPKNGDKVDITGKVSLYEGRGDYQLIANTIRPAGLGDLQQAYLQLKQKLEQQGLFDEKYKKPLPEKVNTLGIVTSATGAAVHDIISVLERRWPFMNVLVYPCQVQGSSDEIIQMVNKANHDNLVDCLIVGRGGGSIEDLWAFNDEHLANCIFESAIPIISAVGHEVDFTICDFVADVRAPTPSAAAELISPDQDHIKNQLTQLNARFSRAINGKLQTTAHQLQQLTQRVKGPVFALQEYQFNVEDLNNRMNVAMNSKVNGLKHQSDLLKQKLLFNNPTLKVEKQSVQLTQLTARLFKSGANIPKTPQQKLQAAMQTLNTLSPLNTLSRGYSITLNENGESIQDVKAVKSGDTIISKLANGEISSKVI